MAGLETEKYIKKRRLTEVYKQLSRGKETDVRKLFQLYHLDSNSHLIPFLSVISVEVVKKICYCFLRQESLVNSMIREMSSQKSGDMQLATSPFPGRGGQKGTLFLIECPDSFHIPGR